MGLFDGLMPILANETLKAIKCLSCQSEFDKKIRRQKIPTINGRAVGPCCKKCWQEADKQGKHKIIDMLSSYWKEINVYDKRAREYVEIIHTRIDEDSWDKEKPVIIEIAGENLDVNVNKILGGDDDMRPMEGLNILLDIVAYHDDHGDWMVH